MIELNFYQLFGVNQDADIKEIRTVYHNLVRLYHPDKGIAKNPEMMKRINEAYDTLKDPVKRAKYDETLANGSNGSAPTPSVPTIKVSAKLINLGQLAWNGQKTGQFRVQKVNLTSEHSLSVDWESLKTPEWASELALEQDEDFVYAEFSISAVAVGAGNHKGLVVVTLKDKVAGEVLKRIEVAVKFSVESIKRSQVVLSSGGIVRVGPLEEGGTTTVSLTLNNSGELLSVRPEIEWVRKPTWAGTIQTYPDKGKIFPLRVEFAVNTSGLDFRSSPFKATLVAKVAKQVVGTVEVVLEVKKKPVPQVKPNVATISLLDLAWNESKLVDVRLDNLGDPPKQQVTAKVKDYCSWLQVVSIEPAAVEVFPKRLRLSAKAIAVSSEGDYVAEVEISDGVNHETLQVLARINPRPTLTVNHPKIELKTRKNGQPSVKLIVDKTNGHIPELKVHWQKMEWYVLKPIPVREDWPVEILLEFNMRGYEGSRYSNNLLLEIYDSDGSTKISSLSIPVSIDVG